LTVFPGPTTSFLVDRLLMMGPNWDDKFLLGPYRGGNRAANTWARLVFLPF
jgi:hypothetical protein